jgi:hypothetical protein
MVKVEDKPLNGASLKRRLVVRSRVLRGDGEEDPSSITLQEKMEI